MVRRSLRTLLQGDQTIVAPGVYDAWSAKLVEDAGFQAVYMSGMAVTGSLLGAPDLGLLTMTEMVNRASAIAKAVKIPVIADADNGYGGPLNVMRTVEDYEAAGVAAIHIEDQVIPKRCGYYPEKELVEPNEMVNRIKATLEARESDEFLIIARSDAIAVEGIEEAIKRAQLYKESGADAIFIEAIESIDQIRLIREEVSGVLMINMVEGSKTPLLNIIQLGEIGYKIVIFSGSLLRVASFAMKKYLENLRSKGSTEEFLPSMMTPNERNRLSRLEEYFELSAKFGG
jgi:2,3-dimethylmalate lyase